MADPFVAEIRIFPFNFAPKGWAFCDGQLLPISQNTALFSLLGTTYGGDGKSTFALPDLQGRAPMHPGQGPGLSPARPRRAGGTETVTLLAERDAGARPRAARTRRRRRTRQVAEPDRVARAALRAATPTRRRPCSRARWPARRWRPPAATSRTTTCSRTSRSTSASPSRVSSRRAADARLRPVERGRRAVPARVYAGTRAEELAIVPWRRAEGGLRGAAVRRPEPTTREHYAGMSADVILVDGEPAGRL